MEKTPSAAELLGHLMTVQQAAEHLNMNLSSVRAAINTKRLKSQRFGKSIFLMKQDVEAFRVSPPRAKPGPKKATIDGFWRKLGRDAGWKVDVMEDAQGEYFFPCWVDSNRWNKGDMMAAMDNFLEGFHAAVAERRAQTKGE